VPFTLFVALRYLKARKRHRALSVNTVISVVGVMCGVAALIATLAVMNGAMEEIRDKILGTNSHIVISHRGGAFGDFEADVQKVMAHPEVVAATPFIYGQAMLTSEFGVEGVVLRGIDPEREGEVTQVADNLVVGSLGALETGAPAGFDPDLGDAPEGPVQPGIVLGRELALKLGALVGSTINVLSPVGEPGPLGIIPKIRAFTVVGIFDAGMYEYDSSLAYVSIPAAQDFLDLGDRVTGIEVRLKDFERAPRVAAALRGELPEGFRVRDWRDLNRNFFQALALEGALAALDGYRDARVVHYERLCADPLEVFRDLYAFAGLAWTQPVEAEIARSSTDPGDRQDPYGTRRDSRSMADAWRAEVTGEALREIRDAYLSRDPALYGADAW